MPADLNRVILIGRLTRTPEVTHTHSGDAVANLRLAVTGRAKDGDGWTDRPNYFDIVVWGRQAEVASEHLTKGRRIGVDGRLSWREWQDADGATRRAVEVVAGDVFFLDAPRETAKEPEAGQTPEPVRVGATTDQHDIPF